MALKAPPLEQWLGVTLQPRTHALCRTCVPRRSLGGKAPFHPLGNKWFGDGRRVLLRCHIEGGCYDPASDRPFTQSGSAPTAFNVPTVSNRLRHCIARRPLKSAWEPAIIGLIASSGAGCLPVVLLPTCTVRAADTGGWVSSD